MNAGTALAAVILGGTILYALLAGADYGAGCWDMLCSGARKQEQQNLIARAIQPVWETNHVWLILVIVLMFSGFPGAFSALSVGLAVPLLFVLLGIVLRGSAFVFRAYFVGAPDIQSSWGRVFSISSSFTPFFLGVIIGAISCNQTIVSHGISVNGFLKTWWGIFPVCVGLLALMLFAFLSASYLTVEATTVELQDDFRSRGLAAWVTSVIMAGITLLMAGSSAYEIRSALMSLRVFPIVLLAICVSLVAAYSLFRRYFAMARVAAALQVALILLGWGLAQYPYIIRPDITISNSQAPNNVLIALLFVAAGGMVVLVPSLTLLLYVFKRRNAYPQRHITTLQ
ncbi:cytochrome d ubiquinol oxidase subunit II [Silvibacterium dinghuense]|uniref:Cytochrome d ubiquinol oxidase subunit II n=1 Tax=Silvibacterium dinghuense TaxID=1560006 RepID=A0A4Q1S8C8_9BACT|nr:cytochrome d ubiquinol oxidase subunit II [Silvibacterium dinghuense]RXS92797.1 cytochrome d ubiquinol oxidase subunit II [Silvibacterium dinghuense]